MYFEHSNANRETWKYSYFGRDLLPYAIRAYQGYLAEEKKARAELSALIADIKISHESKQVQDAKRSIEFNGKQREACSVYVHEFERSRDREFHLNLGDVVFFGLVKEPE